MPCFTVVMDLEKVPPTFVADWWNDYGPSDTTLTDDLERRTVEKLDDRRQRVVTDLHYGRYAVRVDGIVTRDSRTTWSLDGDLYVRGRAFAKELVDFRVDGVGPGSRLIARFAFRGKDPFRSLALTFLRGKLRRGREEAYRAYAHAIVRDFAAAQQGRPAAGP
ncbi:MAG: hypothetical protein KGJ23_06265 [Euryarchaeota archaeon]|nr:hypothetical protein [Euryarchaeota archaeon]MDE1836204.1 hypothetical protein [Euryarchaeota archaeon]MDE1881187.1 hypothetical protein [Euryarchaeota archaeon]MDE2045035.1 hypothetical protein [Thermoplasmata archaeon]